MYTYIIQRRYLSRNQKSASDMSYSADTTAPASLSAVSYFNASCAAWRDRETEGENKREAETEAHSKDDYEGNERIRHNKK